MTFGEAGHRRRVGRRGALPCARHVCRAGGLKEALTTQPAGREPVGKGGPGNRPSGGSRRGSMGLSESEPRLARQVGNPAENGKAQ